MSGVLSGVRVVEMAGIGPAPFCAMTLADHGAEVIRIARPGHESPVPVDRAFEVTERGRPTVELDLRSETDKAALWRLIARADMLIEGFRPGVMERMGFGPDAVLARRPALVYGRITGWGREGPMAMMAGHDLNYAGLTGAIAAMGDPDRPPVPPLNLVADYGGGAMYLAFGVVAALWRARVDGVGRVVDTAMVDGTAALMSLMYGLRAGGAWSDRRGDNPLDGGVPFYACYAASDGGFVAVCPLEPAFFAAFLERAGLADDPDFARQYDRTKWPRMRERLTELFAAHPRDHWAALFDGSDACVTPVLSMAEAPDHPHNRARGVFHEVGGVPQPGPAPRFSGTETAGPPPVNTSVLSVDAALANWDA